MQAEANDHNYKEAVKALNDKAKEKKTYFKGLALGLFYGIIGNMLVSHYYSVFVGVATYQFDNLFYWNLVGFLISLSLILFVTFKWVRSMFRIDEYLQFVEQVKTKYNLDDDFNEK